jgi:UDP-GlcNAc:undecaprenyl-phosphate GlcNAc-1-phosphate transferase
VQIAAALLVSLWGGVLLERFSNPFFGLGLGHQYLEFGFWSVPITVIWIVAVTNSVNFIDGLDGLAVGVSGIASATMLVTALIVSDGNTAIVMAALAGACIGFIPYNLNPAKIFMGDCGALLLGFVLATMSLLGLFKEYTLISFGVPFLILALPIFDEVFAVFRRLAKGQKPWARDRGHLHHRLIDLGLTQKQAVAICYAASTVLGVLAVVLTADGGVKAFLYGLVIVITAAVAITNFRHAHNGKGKDDDSD